METSGSTNTNTNTNTNSFGSYGASIVNDATAPTVVDLSKTSRYELVDNTVSDILNRLQHEIKVLERKAEIEISAAKAKLTKGINDANTRVAIEIRKRYKQIYFVSDGSDFYYFMNKADAEEYHSKKKMNKNFKITAINSSDVLDEDLTTIVMKPFD